MASPKVPNDVWLVIWRRRGGGRIERQAFVSEGGAKRAIRGLQRADRIFDWCFREPIHFGMQPRQSARCASQEPK